jgi:hypothetical protein
MKAGEWAGLMTVAMTGTTSLRTGRQDTEGKNREFSTFAWNLEPRSVFSIRDSRVREAPTFSHGADNLFRSSPDRQRTNQRSAVRSPNMMNPLSVVTRVTALLSLLLAGCKTYTVIPYDSGDGPSDSPPDVQSQNDTLETVTMLADGESGVGGTGGLAAGGVGAGVGGAAPDAGADLPGKALGDGCTGDQDCNSGHCAGTVCCDQACMGVCQQCSATGHCQMPVDDQACGTISCPADTGCRDYATVIGTNRCAALGPIPIG